jgi:hypothetical protein
VEWGVADEAYGPDIADLQFVEQTGLGMDVDLLRPPVVAKADDDAKCPVVDQLISDAELLEMALDAGISGWGSDHKMRAGKKRFSGSWKRWQAEEERAMRERPPLRK